MLTKEGIGMVWSLDCDRVGFFLVLLGDGRQEGGTCPVIIQSGKYLCSTFIPGMSIIIIPCYQTGVYSRTSNKGHSNEEYNRTPLIKDTL